MERWWEDQSDARVLGVFQGGGAKGVAYAGALRAVAACGLWFSQVSGASAGAITAVLVAAGVRPDELDEVTEQAMGSIRWQVFGLVLGQDSLLKSSGVGDWLDGELRRRVRGSDDSSTPGVTFAELEQASGIDCHVVALDLGTGYPIVFSGSLTPKAAVVEAVLASSAIPGALSAGRAVVPQPGGGPARVHHLIDGGAWANYPAFVFRERAFRSWAGLETDLGSTPLIGFALDSPPSQPSKVAEVRPRRWRSYPEADLGVGRSSRSLPIFAVSLLFGTRGWRLVLALLAAFLAVVAIRAIPEITAYLSDLGWWAFDWWGGPVIAGLGSLLVVFGVALVLLAVLGVIALGRAIAYSGLTSARALLGVTTRVPPWAHEQPEALVLNLRSLGLTTLRFRPGQAKRAEVVDTAELEARQQLDAAAEKLKRWGARPAQLERAAAAPEPPRAVAPRPGGGAGLLAAPLALAVGVFLLGLAAAFIMRGLWQGQLWLGLLFALLSVGYIAAVARLLNHRARARAAGEPPFGNRALAVIGAIWMVAIAAMLLTASVDSDRDLVRAEVASAAEVKGSDDTRYTWVERGDGNRRGAVRDDLDYRVGDNILVEASDGEPERWRLASPNTSFSVLFLPVGFALAAIASFFFITDELLYRRYRRTVEAAEG